jgi:hypothetical protein
MCTQSPPPLMILVMGIKYKIDTEFAASSYAPTDLLIISATTTGLIEEGKTVEML